MYLYILNMRLGEPLVYLQLGIQCDWRQSGMMLIRNSQLRLRPGRPRIDPQGSPLQRRHWDRQRGD